MVEKEWVRVKQNPLDRKVWNITVFTVTFLHTGTGQWKQFTI